MSSMKGTGAWLYLSYLARSRNGENRLSLMEGVTDFVGTLMAVGSSILYPFIIRFEMQILPPSLGKEFGKLRFLKGWLFLCGLQPMVRF